MKESIFSKKIILLHKAEEDFKRKLFKQFKDKKRERLIQLLILKQYFKSTGQYG